MFISYKRNDIELPLFSQIAEICIITNETYLVCRDWITAELNDVYQAYVKRPLHYQ